MVSKTAAPKMGKQSYIEKLRDPRWQRKRLEALQRDNFTCLFCKDDKRTLHVHHCYYTSGLEPWEYPLSSLLTLCADCHQQETDAGPYYKSSLFDELARRGLTGSDIEYLTIRLFQLPDIVWRDLLYPALYQALDSLESERTDDVNA